MKKSSSCAVERVHLVKCVPRSYDMSRTHIVHKSESRHVDVILRCAPKKWKKKKVRVTVIKNGKKKEYVRIRANAKKGYIAVRKAINHEYDPERENIAAFDEKKVIRYDKVKVANRGLIHDMKSQVAIMAKKSADYIENQLSEETVRNADVPAAPAPAPVFAVEPKVAPSPTVEPAVKAPSVNPCNPYASDYSKHFSNAEFHDLMDSLEKSLDEACKKHNIGFAQPEPENARFVQSSVSGYPRNEGVSVSASTYQPWNAASQPSAVSPRVEEEEYKPVPLFPKDEGDEFKPVPLFPKDEEEEFKPVPMFPKDEEEEYKPVPMFPKDEEEEYKPVPMFPKDEEEEYKPVPMFPKDEEEEFKPVPMFPKDEEEEYKPVPLFPKDEEEEFKPVPMFPKDEEEPSAPVESYPQPQPSESYSFPPETFSPPPVSCSQPQTSGSVKFEDSHERQTFFSRTGDQIKKVIGIIRGKTSKKNNDEYTNENVEITYSDDDNNPYKY